MDRIAALLAAAAPVTEALSGAGRATVLVGGAVRDALDNRPWREVDIATSASEAELTQLLAPLGAVRVLGFGVVQLRRQQAVYHLARLRREADYQDWRHPSLLQDVDSVEADLVRRDYTVNAIALTADGKWIDPFDGRADLLARRLRALPPAGQRLAEDPLRILRGIRLISSHSLGADVETEAALWQPEALVRCPRARADEELWRLLEGEAAPAAWKHYQPLLRQLWPWAGSVTWAQRPADAALAILSLAVAGGDGDAALTWLKGRLGSARWQRLARLLATLRQGAPGSAEAERQLISNWSDDELGWLAEVDPVNYQGALGRRFSESPNRQLALTATAIAKFCRKAPGPWLRPCQDWLWQRVWQDPSQNTRHRLKAALVEWQARTRGAKEDQR